MLRRLYSITFNNRDLRQAIDAVKIVMSKETLDRKIDGEVSINTIHVSLKEFFSKEQKHYI